MSLGFEASPFRSFLMGGFECSTHYRHDGQRIDVIAATQHDKMAATDYRMLNNLGIRTVRDGLRWHLIEKFPNQFQWSSALPMIRAAVRNGTQVIWDLFHYGWPDHIDIWSPAFVDHFFAYAKNVGYVMRNEGAHDHIFVPVNEISFTAWAGGQVGYLNPFARGRGPELKCQLVRAAIAGMDAIRSELPQARFAHVEPAINVVPNLNEPSSVELASRQHQAQYEAWDMLSGKQNPELGGANHYLDILGINYYTYNQWRVSGEKLRAENSEYIPFSMMLKQNHDRYQRLLFIAETGIEGTARPVWFTMISREIKQAQRLNVPVQGLCLYPVLNHPGWDNDRLCPNGLIDYEPRRYRRTVNAPLLSALRTNWKMP